MFDFLIGVATYESWGLLPAIVTFVPFAVIAYSKGKHELKQPRFKTSFHAHILFVALVIYPYVVGFLAQYFGQTHYASWMGMAMVWFILAVGTVAEVVEAKSHRYTHFAIGTFLLINNAFVWANALQG